MEQYKYNVRDIFGKPVPDSRIKLGVRDLILSSGDYDSDCKKNVRAYQADGSCLPLSSVNRDRLKFIGGLWRVQRILDVKITKVRDKKFVLGKKLNIREKNLFEYYSAANVCENCYGIMELNFDFIVAKYDTDNGAMWSYGTTVEQARAFLGIALFDKHIESIHAIERKNHTK